MFFRPSKFAPSTVNVDKSVEIGKAQLEACEKDWHVGFNSPIPKKIITTVISKKVSES